MANEKIKQHEGLINLNNEMPTETMKDEVKSKVKMKRPIYLLNHETLEPYKKFATLEEAAEFSGLAKERVSWLLAPSSPIKPKYWFWREGQSKQKFIDYEKKQIKFGSATPEEKEKFERRRVDIEAYFDSLTNVLMNEYGVVDIEKLKTTDVSMLEKQAKEIGWGLPSYDKVTNNTSLGRQKKCLRPIYLLDHETLEPYKEFATLEEVSECLGLRKLKISVLLAPSSPAHPKHWFWREGQSKQKFLDYKEKQKIKKQEKPIYLLDHDTLEPYKEFLTLEEAAEFSGFAKSSVKVMANASSKVHPKYWFWREGQSKQKFIDYKEEQKQRFIYQRSETNKE